MARPTCRCGEILDVPPGRVEHMTCPRCGARVRLVRKPSSTSGDGEGGAGSASNTASASAAGPAINGGDGFIRFACPCGRRLKVSAADRPTHGKCPDCDRVVPVPAGAGLPSAAAMAEALTQEMGVTDRATLEGWVKSHVGPKSTSEMPHEPAAVNRRGGEAGLRVCPRCGKPIHLGADACRTCGVSVPRHGA